MQRSMTGRKALVTGGSRRLGRAIATRLAAAGADLALHYRSDEAGAMETAADVRAEHGVEVQVVQADLADVEASVGLVGRVEDALGPLDLLVNNAAAFVRTPLADMKPADFDLHMEANGRSIYLLSLEAGRRMKTRGSGVIVNLADVAGIRPWPAYVPYSASKGAAWNLTLGFAKALAPEVRVNGVAPGPVLPPAGEAPEQGEKAVRTTLLGRWGAPADIAEAVLFLATSPYVTGVVLPVDGGRSIAMGGA